MELIDVIREEDQSWVQVVGAVAVHDGDREPRKLSGSTEVLLAILVAAGPDGLVLEEIADAYWGQDRPASWQVALRVSASHLNAQLPSGWQVVATPDGVVRIDPGRGFIDAWQIEAAVVDPASTAAGSGWGDPYPGISGVPLIDRAAQRLKTIRCQTSHDIVPTATQSENQDGLEALVRNERRALFTCDGTRCSSIIEVALADETFDTNVVIGDSDLPMPLGPYVIAYPELRTELAFEAGEVDGPAINRAWRILADATGRRSGCRPRRLVIANAHELDPSSLELTSLLIERGPSVDFAIILCASGNCSDPDWLNFLDRAFVAGCRAVPLDLCR